MAFAVHAPMGRSSSSSNNKNGSASTRGVTSPAPSGNNNRRTGNSWGDTPSTLTTSSATGVGFVGQMTTVDDTAVDAYAKQVLEEASPLDAGVVDADYLAPYITGVVRAEQGSASQLEHLPDYDNLLELLQEHCSMARTKAKEALQKIAQAVMKGMVPVEFYYNYNNPDFDSSAATAAHTAVVGSPALGPFGSPPSSLNSQSLTALQLLEFVNVEAAAQEAEEKPTARTLSDDFQSLQLNSGSVATATATSDIEPNSKDATATTNAVTSGPEVSPVQPNNLIPGYLLGEIDYDEDAAALAAAAAAAAVASPEGDVIRNANNSSNEEGGEEDPLQEEFPSLAAAAASASKLSKKSSRRSRQGSIDDSTISEHSSRKVSPNLQPQMQQQHPGQYPYYYSLDGTSAADAIDPALMLQYACDYLVGLNPDIGQDAVFHAATMAQSNVPVAQYLLDCAMTAPPVCRHLLHSGCYRSDCHFSHDLEGHTCVFWLRGRCTKGSSCQFLHGFNDKWLVKLEEQQQQHLQKQQEMMEQSYQQQQHNHHQDYYNNGMEQTMPDTSAARTSSATSNSFANIASQGYNDRTCFQQQSSHLSGASATSTDSASEVYDDASLANIPTMKIPQDVWNPHERRDASAFHIADPIERYREVTRHHSNVSNHSSHHGGGRHHHNSSHHDNHRTDVIDLHFQSTKTFGIVLEHVLPEKLGTELQGVWIVTGTGHHVGTKTHQKGGGILESAVMHWLLDHGYEFWKGKDRNGHGGAVFVKTSGGGIT